MPKTIGIYLGTAEESVQNIEKQLRAWQSLLDGYELELFGSAAPPSSVTDGYRYRPTTARTPGNAMVKQAATYRDAGEYIDSADPDILVQLWNYPGHAPGISLAGWRHDIPVVTRFSGDHFRESAHFSGFQRLFYFTYLNLLGRLPLLLSDAVIALGPHGAAELRAHGADTDDVHILPPAVGTEQRFHPPTDTATHRQELDIPEGKTILLYVGRLSALKGMDFLSQVITALAATDDFLFVLVGDGEYGEKLDAKFDDDTVLQTGYADYSQIDRYYKAADAYVHCSPYEGIPAVILEALQCQLPVVARRAGDIEFVTPNVVETPTEMATLIRERGWSPEWRNRDRFEPDHQRDVLQGVFDALS